jgi:hypothetical protein
MVASRASSGTVFAAKFGESRFNHMTKSYITTSDLPALRQRLCLDLETIEQARRILTRLEEVGRAIEDRVTNVLRTNSNEMLQSTSSTAELEAACPSNKPAAVGTSRERIAQGIAHRLLAKMIAKAASEMAKSNRSVGD